MGHIRAILLAASALLSGAASAPPPAMLDGAGAAAELPTSVVLLFWASWCAPCREEAARLGELARAAAPMQVMIVPIDSGRAARRALDGVPPDRLRYPKGDAIAFMQRWTDGAVGLPASVAIGADGGRCALKFGGVTAADMTAWRARCLANLQGG